MDSVLAPEAKFLGTKLQTSYTGRDDVNMVHTAQFFRSGQAETSPVQVEDPNTKTNLPITTLEDYPAKLHLAPYVIHLPFVTMALFLFRKNFYVGYIGLL